MDCRLVHGILWVLQETFSKAYLLEKDHPQLSFTIQEFGIIFLRIGTSCYNGTLERGETRFAEFFKPTPRSNQGLGTLNPLYHTGGTSSQNGVMDHPRYPISELHLGKFPDSLEFPSWKVNFKTEVCANSVLPQIIMHWIKEVEIAKSMKDLVTSQSITGRTDVSDHDMLDAMIASALMKLLTHALPKKE